MMNRRDMLKLGFLGAAMPVGAFAQGGKPLKIGVLNDMSSVYADYQGIGSVIAAQMAVDDYAQKLGIPVEIVSADHLQKPDVGSPSRGAGSTMKASTSSWTCRIRRSRSPSTHWRPRRT